jgi:hypothetical protein
LGDSHSFVVQLGRMLTARKKHHVAEGKLLAVPKVSNRAVCILVMQAPGPARAVITAMNFSQKPLREELDLRGIKGLGNAKLTGKLLDIITGERMDDLPDSGRMTIELPGLTVKTILIEKAD